MDDLLDFLQAADVREGDGRLGLGRQRPPRKAT